MPIVVLLAALPLSRATWANRRTALLHAIFWTWVAWACWLGYSLNPTSTSGYVSICASGCAGVAVLGARRPGVLAWNFVVVGLWIVLLLPLAEGAATGAGVQLDTPRRVFLYVLLGTCILNYVPTRMGLGAILLGLALIFELRGFGSEKAIYMAAISPWLAWAGLRWAGPHKELDHHWNDFRDRFGAIWAIRLREQFQAAAGNAQLGAQLSWRGFSEINPGNADAVREILTALMKRFY